MMPDRSGRVDLIGVAHDPVRNVCDFSGSCTSLRRARPLLGTIVEIGIETPCCPLGASGAHPEAAVEAAFAAVATVHRLMSFHEDDSDIARLNREAADRPVEVDPLTYRVLDLALALYRDSAGLFDIAVAPVLQELGLLPDLPGKPAAPCDDGTGAPIQLMPGYRVRLTRQGVAIDLGGIAKGFAVDRAVEALLVGGVTQAIVNAGGDLAAFGPARHRVHIRDPRHPDRLMAEVDVSNGAIATSGGRFDPMLSAAPGTCAVIDPVAQAPVRAVLGATVRAPRCVLADALTKVVMIAGVRAAPLLARHSADALFVGARGDIQISADWRGAVQLAA